MFVHIELSIICNWSYRIGFHTGHLGFNRHGVDARIVLIEDEGDIIHFIFFIATLFGAVAILASLW